MSDIDTAAPTETTAPSGTASTRELPPAAQRALAEAAARRAARGDAGQPTERHGRGGLEPVRYGDWEIKGLAVDF